MICEWLPEGDYALRFSKWWLIIDYWWIASGRGLRFMDWICATHCWIYECGFVICEWLPEGDFVLQIWFRLLKVMIDHWLLMNSFPKGECFPDMICATHTWIYEFGFMICEALPERDCVLRIWFTLLEVMIDHWLLMNSFPKGECFPDMICATRT
jgi:hypothetical protein